MIRGGSVVTAGIVCVAATTSCRSATDVGQASPPASTTSGLSIVLEPRSVSVAPGGSTQSLGTIRGATKTALSAVIDVPNEVIVRVTSVTTTDTVLTKKYIVFANAAAVPGTYILRVRVTASGEADVEAALTLTVTQP